MAENAIVLRPAEPEVDMKLRLPVSLHARLKEAGKRTGRTMNDVAEELLAAALDKAKIVDIEQATAPEVRD